MREILFKAKRLDNNEWVYGSFVFTEHNTAAIMDCSYGERTEYRVAVNTICQCIGKTYNKGVKIWEDDLFELTLEGIDTHIELVDVQVVFDKSHAAFCFKSLTESSSKELYAMNDKRILSLKYKGNIHE